MAFGRLNILGIFIMVLSLVVIHILLLTTLRLYGTDSDKPYYIYNEKFAPETSMEMLGLMTTMRLDLKNFLFGSYDSDFIEERTEDSTK